MIPALWVLAPLSVEAQTANCPTGDTYTCYVGTTTGADGSTQTTTVYKGEGRTLVECENGNQNCS